MVKELISLFIQESDELKAMEYLRIIERHLDNKK